MTGRIGAPLHGGFFFGENDGVFHLDSGFGFEHKDGIGGFSHEIGLVFELVGAMAVIDLKLSLGRLEPFDRIAL